MSPRKTDAEIEQLWQAHEWGCSAKYFEELREDHRRARASEAKLLEALAEVGHLEDDGACWCSLPSMIPYRGHDAGCQLARAALAQAEGREP